MGRFRPPCAFGSAGGVGATGADVGVAAGATDGDCAAGATGAGVVAKDGACCCAEGAGVGVCGGAGIVAGWTVGGG